MELYSSRVRALYRSVADKYYRDKFRWSKHCVYCGVRASGVDHVIPVSQFVKRSMDPRDPEVRKQLLRVPCCISCNSMLSDKLFSSFKERRKFARKYSNNVKNKFEIPPKRPQPKNCNMKTLQAALASKKVEPFSAEEEIEKLRALCGKDKRENWGYKRYASPNIRMGSENSPEPWCSFTTFEGTSFFMRRHKFKLDALVQVELAKVILGRKPREDVGFFCNITREEFEIALSNTIADIERLFPRTGHRTEVSSQPTLA